MSSLITINNTSALHLPTADASPVHLANGDLTLVLIPANPPTHPSETLTLSIGASSFPLLPNSPLQKVQTTNEHPTFQFTPVPADGGAGVGQVRIQLAPSKNQEQWDATEAQAKQLESLLRAYKLWDEKILFVNDEYETTGEPVKGWGETVASTLAGGASFLAGKIAGFTDRFPELISSHLQHPPGKPVLPTTENAAKVTAVRNATAQAAVKADEAAVAIGNKVHDAGVKLGEKLPDELAKPSPAVQQGEKGEARKLAEEGWHQATIAAKGLADAAATIGGSISGNAHKAIEHNYGTEADRVAQDVGQAGANVGQAALSAGKATSVIIQGNNVAQGAAQGKSA